MKKKKNKKPINPVIMIWIVMIIIVVLMLVLGQTDKLGYDSVNKKTLTDLSCDELKDYFVNGRQCEGIWPHRVCKYPDADSSPTIGNSTKAKILYQIVFKKC